MDTNITINTRSTSLFILLHIPSRIPRTHLSAIINAAITEFGNQSEFNTLNTDDIEKYKQNIQKFVECQYNELNTSSQALT